MILEWLALIFLIVFVPVPIIWFVTHPFINFWRKHPSWHRVVIIFWLAAAVFFFQVRAWVWSSQVELRILPVIGAIVAFWFAFWLDRQRAKVFTNKQLFGLPEVFPKKYKPVLVTSGIYGRLRHPRYVVYIALAWGMALLTRFPSVYVAALYLTITLYMVMLLEERELKQRFGKAYEEYMETVPRWWPRRG